MLGKAGSMARLDRKRKGKKLSSWVSKSDPEAKIAKMKDHRRRPSTRWIWTPAFNPADATPRRSTLAKAEANLEAVCGTDVDASPTKVIAVLRALNDSPWKTRIAAPKQTGFSRCTVMRRRGARSPTTVRGSSPGSPARPSSAAEIVERLRSRHATNLAARARECAQAIPAPRRRHNLSLLMRQLIGAGTPREAVAGGYGGIFVLLTPTGAMLVARGVSQSRRLSPPHSSSGSESRKKPLNQRLRAKLSEEGRRIGGTES